MLGNLQEIRSDTAPSFDQDRYAGPLGRQKLDRRCALQVSECLGSSNETNHQALENSEAVSGQALCDWLLVGDDRAKDAAILRKKSRARIFLQISNSSTSIQFEVIICIKLRELFLHFEQDMSHRQIRVSLRSPYDQ